MSVPALDLILHNLIALGIALVLLMVVAQLLLTALLRIGDAWRAQLLRSPLLGAMSDGRLERAEASRKRMKRATLTAVALASVLLFIGGAVLTFLRMRALDLTKGWLGELRHEDFKALGIRVAYAAGVGVAGAIASSLSHTVVDVLVRLSERSAMLATNRELAAEVLKRLRLALRVGISCTVVTWMSVALGLPSGIHRAIVLAADVAVAFYVCRFVVVLAHLGVELLFEMSGKLTKLESPLKYLGSLTHLKGITKRSIDYFVYVATVTWVADQFTPDTWFSRAGRVGIRMVAIFYTSRVLIEVCLLFINEIFLNKTAGHTTAEIQQRKTLVPVAVGVLRYGIYFSALVMVLREANIDPTPLLAGAGVLGVAVGFGAQAFVGDIVAGFFILFENVLLVGDNIEVSGVRGTVEEIGVRITKIRDESGVLHAIPNGDMRKIANHSRTYVNAVVDVHVPYDTDLVSVRGLLKSVTEEMLQAELGEPVKAHVTVQELGQTAVLLRVTVRVPPGKDDDIATSLRAHLIEELRGAGVVMPQRVPACPLESTKLQIARPVEPKAVAESGPAQLFKVPGAD